MRPPVSLRSFVSIRTYATRLPERPPYRAPDPLVNNPHAEYNALPGELTFIHRPPPTAPAPDSYATLPTSPLLKSESNAPSELPPQLFARKKPEPARMSDEDIQKMQQLRREDPQKWTAGKLAKEFGCTQGFARMFTKLPKAEQRKALARRDVEHDKHRAKWGEKKLLQQEIRAKRKEFW
ncbi:hypothetical protein PHLGIDRAFT_75527 [Phlebiopsis gigantea 11061_1 CR5-6]|uniref:Uncharacterized protein n=1 Tax=Phlebiopsis gigantea (strain 11061_1 CR5-6) TaxID=745531 RepID=A0A0C3PG42_PHLG1|nr:hypothetical protein PHLGIDRAFT_75527 [Phlebiopsis gigantea 11061_1 CR5-6]